jgi:hypothetical protein
MAHTKSRMEDDPFRLPLSEWERASSSENAIPGTAGGRSQPSTPSGGGSKLVRQLVKVGHSLERARQAEAAAGGDRIQALLWLKNNPEGRPSVVSTTAGGHEEHKQAEAVPFDIEAAIREASRRRDLPEIRRLMRIRASGGAAAGACRWIIKRQIPNSSLLLPSSQSYPVLNQVEVTHIHRPRHHAQRHHQRLPAPALLPPHLL